MDWLIRVEDVCRQLLTAKRLRERLLDLVREQVPYDGHVFALTDPDTMVGTSPHAHVPMLPWSRLPELIRWRYQSVATRVDRLVDRPAVSLLTAVADPSDVPVWARVQRELGVTDIATVVFADRYGVWGFLELWRTTGEFTAGELIRLTSLQQPVTGGIRGALARTFVDPGEQLLPIGPAVVVLGPDLAVRTQTEAAAAALLQLLPPDEPMAPIPAAVYNVGATLLAAEAGLPLGEPWGRVHLGGSRWVTVKASRLGPVPESDIAVSIEPSTPAERSDLFARAHGLSAREAEVLGLIATGLDSRAVAGLLFLSEHTVNDHVKAVLAKTGARTRQLLLARALGAG